MGSRARCRELSGPGDVGAIPTPAPALLTSRGQLPNLPRELLELCLSASDPPLLLQCPLIDWFCLNPNKQVLGADLLKGTRGLHSFAALPRSVTLLSVRSAESTDFVTPAPGRALVITTDAPSHRLSVSPKQVVDLYQSLGVDYFEAPSDCPFLHAPSKRAIPRSVERAAALVDETLGELNANISDRPARPGMRRKAMFVPIQGGVSEQHRSASCSEAVKRFGAHGDAIAGFTIGGLFAGESPSERRKAIEVATSELPAGPLRILAGHGGGPADVLDAVERGIDVIESAYPFSVAASGYALDLENGVKLNLRDRKWERNKGPLVDGCSCIACRPGDKTGGIYTRGYIRHLLEVHEMMGETLLVAHNVRNYLNWFSKLRAAVAEGTFDEFRVGFLKTREHARNHNTSGLSGISAL